MCSLTTKPNAVVVACFVEFLTPNDHLRFLRVVWGFRVNAKLPQVLRDPDSAAGFYDVCGSGKSSGQRIAAISDKQNAATSTEPLVTSGPMLVFQSPLPP